MSQDKGPADNLDDIWSTVDLKEGQPDEGEARAPGHADEGMSHLDDEMPIIDAEDRHKPAKKSHAGLVIAFIGLLVVGGVGAAGYSFYNRMFSTPATGVELAGGATLIGTDPIPISASEQAAADAAALPYNASGRLPDDMPAAPNPNLVSSPDLGIQPLDATPALMPASPAVDAPIALVPAAALLPVPSFPACPAVKAAPACAASPPVAAKKSQPKRVVRSELPAHVVAKAPAKPAGSLGSSVASGVPVVALGRLTGFKVMAIEPKSGAHQQAWLRDPEGKLFIVREGDSFQGARVRSVSFVDGLVATDAGYIRK